MKKEVKRSLLVWPCLASATMIGLMWLTGPQGFWVVERAEQLMAQPQGRVWPEAPAFTWEEAPVQTLTPSDDPPALASDDSSPATDLVERSEQGSPAMKVPPRLNDALAGSAKPRLMAPVRDVRRETAGLMLLPAKPNDRPNPDVTLGAPASQFPGSESAIIEAEDLLPPQRPTIAASTPLQQGFKPELHLDATVELPGPVGPPPFVGPLRPPVVRRPQVAEKRATVLPKSIAILGKLDPETNLETPAEVVRRLTPPAPQPSIVANPVEVAREESKNTPSRTEVSPAGWPITQSLDDQLAQLVRVANGQPAASRFVSSSSAKTLNKASMWADEVQLRLNELRHLPRVGDPRAGDLIDELSDLAKEGYLGAERMTNREQQILWLCSAHAIARRVAVWSPIWQITNSTEPNWMVSDQSDPSADSINSTIEQIRTDLSQTGDELGWTRYLMLDELSLLAQTDQFEQRQITAQRFLSRLQWHRLGDEHVRWLNRESVMQLCELVRPWARNAVDYARLLQHIERQESDAIDLAGIEIASAIQSLRFADNPDAIRVADALNTYYRNANVRMAISETMLQRMIPSIDPQSVPVKTRLFGSQVRGVSEIKSNLMVKLNPSADRWSMELRTLGDVKTKSTGYNGPVALITRGDSKFVAATPIEITPKGFQLGASDVNVRGTTRLRRVRSDYDGWPLIGSLVQGVAASRFESVAPQSSRIANRQIRDQVAEEIDEEVNEKLQLATKQLGQLVLGPLGRLQLDPQVIDLQTTQQRLLARYRLAGDWQLGAFTPRPRAPRSSLMSLQIHQSALNNMLEQLVPKEQAKSIDQVVREGLEMFGQNDVALPEDLPENVVIQFAPTRPITVEIEDGEFWVTLRVIRLTRDRMRLSRFIVRALYRPEMNGLDATLVRDGHLRISGPGMSMRERLPLRAIFNKVLSPNRPLRLTLPSLMDHPATENLAISQLELRQGWLAMAISEVDAPRIALKRKEEE